MTVMKSWVDLHDFEADRCPHCHFELAWNRAPEWVKHGAVFALDGKSYRIESVGGSNRKHYPHFAVSLRVTELRKEKWEGLPAAPAHVNDVSIALRNLFSLTEIDGRDLVRAIHVVT